ncbi:MAG: GIY-YIG nuclease family protein [Saprospiraceae bacterium]|nr:GIY-YIG nuclease family protein [Saprospiraceae bacterium]
MERKYAIIDIETTGGKATRDRITEIAIVVHDGEKVIDQWETLVNPECYIPYGITQLTGITQDMVNRAPKFYEVAKTIVEKTEGAIFVAHNVRFDYSFVKEEFRRLGFTYTRKQLCTVRLSRQAFPGLRSYGLDSLIRHFNIHISSRHRAMGDTLATTEVFEKIISSEYGAKEVTSMINLGIKESLLPSNLSLEKIHELPETCGVYYFHDQHNQLAYIGKSINIQKRVAEHFADVSEKARKMQQQVYDVSYEETGSELVALLLESHEIKTKRPYLNQAQRVRYFPYVIHTFQNEQGYICFDVVQPNTKERKQLNVLSEYSKVHHAKGKLNVLAKKLELCARYSGLEQTVAKKVCFNYHLKQCRGACGELESVEAYNERATLALGHLTNVFEEDMLLIDRGRSKDESAVILIENGEYQGFTYLDKNDTYTSLDNIKSSLPKRYESNPEVKRIIRRFLEEKGKVRVVKFKPE